jgi:hypothetical protein
MSARRQKIIAVVVATTDVPRLREALRAAVGLSLRGDAVRVVLMHEPPADDPLVSRALGTLRELGHQVSRGDAGRAVRDADATEVWT